MKGGGNMAYCPNCGQPLDSVTGRCPVCGQDGGSTYSDNTSGGFGSLLKAQLNSPFLAAIAVIQTFIVLLKITKTFSDTDVISHIPLIATVYTVALWMIYAAVRSDGDEMKLGGMKMMSVALSVIRVIIWICVGVLVVAGVILIAAPKSVDAELKEIIAAADSVKFFSSISNGEISTFFGFSILFWAVELIICNIFYYGNISVSVKSVLESLETDQNRLTRLEKARLWLIIAGIFACVRFAFSFIPSSGESTGFFSNAIQYIRMMGSFFPIKADGSVNLLGMVKELAEIAFYFTTAAYANQIQKLNLPQN